jgi:tRNA threonylcarbamoyladenosine biosynthesis protein TsaE
VRRLGAVAAVSVHFPPPEERRAESASAGETRALGERLGRALQPGDFVGLVGDLGAGKTELVRGIAEGLGVERSQVSSPTFAIVYPYEGGRLTLFHADLYRVGDFDELYATGFLDLVGPSGAMVVEWIDRIWNAAPEDALIVTLQPAAAADPDCRTLHARAHGPRSAQLLRDWLD